MSNEKIFAIGKDLKEGKYVIIDDIPCRIMSIDKSKPGKHGAAKMRITAIGVFDGQKKNLLIPSDGDVEVPIIDRATAQIISVNGPTVQLMDTTTFETFDLTVPEELLSEVGPGKECELMVALGKRSIIRVLKQ